MFDSVPGYININATQFIGHFKNLLKLHTPIQDDSTIYSFSCRTLFFAIVNSYKKKLNIVTTPFLHTGFNAIVRDHNVKYIDIKDDYQFEINDQLKDKDILLISHTFGFPFKINNLIKKFKEYNRDGIVIEDCVQGGFCYQGNKESDIRLFSCGQDKIPVALGGGYGIFKNNVVQNKVYEELETYPTESYWKRFLVLLEKLFITIIYNSPLIVYALKVVCYLMNMKYSDFAHSFRKKIPGFVHDRSAYCKRPSNAQKWSIVDSLIRTYPEKEQYERKRKVFYDNLKNKKVLPWAKYFDYGKSSNFYNHIFIKNKKMFFEKMNKFGIICMDQQSWYVDESTPKAFKLKEHLVLIPNFKNLNDNEIKMLAKIV